MIQSINTATFFKDIYVKQASGSWDKVIDLPAVIFFHASWCGVCKKMTPRLEQKAIKYADKVKVFSVDGDQEKALFEQLEVGFLPSLLLIPKDGEATIKEGEPDDALLEKYFELLSDA